MDFKTKRRLTYVTIALMFMFSGVEYAVVFPTIWAYLKRLGTRDEAILGLAIGGYSVPSIIIGPVIGKLFDKFHNAKAILIVVNAFSIVGSIGYFVAPGPWFIVASRFICGIGCSGITVVLADISNSTPVEERTSIIATFQACIQVGLLIGPGFNLLLRELNFKIGDFVVDKFTAPGLFMMVVGIILEILYVTVYFNLGKLYNKQRLVESLQHSYAHDSIERTLYGDNVAEGGDLYHSINNCHGHEPVDSELSASLHNSGQPEDADKSPLGRYSPGHFKQRMAQRPMSPNSDDMIEDAENFMYSIGESNWQKQKDSRPSSENSKHSDPRHPDVIPDALSSNYPDDKIHSISLSPNPSPDQSISQSQVVSLQWSQKLEPYKDEFLRDEIIVLLGLSFVASFAQASLETIATPLTQRLYSFGDFANSLFYLACGIELLLAFMLIRLLSRKIEDRVLILVGSISMIFSLAWYLAVIPNLPRGDWSTLPYFLIGIFTNVLGISLLIACCISLFSKLISSGNQGIGHGIRRTALGVGMILGPIWGGAALHIPRGLFIVPLAMISCFTILFYLSYRRLRAEKQRGEPPLRVRQRQNSGRLSRNSAVGESSPLLDRSQ